MMGWSTHTADAVHDFYLMFSAAGSLLEIKSESVDLGGRRTMHDPILTMTGCCVTCPGDGATICLQKSDVSDLIFGQQYLE